MRIEGLTIERFGVWSGLELDRLPETLIVVYGPNEAGKTTLLEFLRAVLFGFTPERRQLALYGGAKRGGGTLRMAHRGRSFRLTRHVRADSDQEQSQLRTADGRPCSEHELAELLGGLGDEVFSSVFAVGLRELQALAVLTDTEAAELLLATSAGLGPANLRRIFDELDRARQRLVGGNGAAGEIAHLLNRQRQIHDQVEHAARQLQQYGQLLQQKRELDRRIERLTQRHQTLRQHQRLLTLAGQVGDRWRSLRRIERQLETLGEPKTIRPELRDELGLLESALEKRARIEQAIDARASKLNGELGQLAVNRALCRLGPRIEALAEQASWSGQLRQRLQELEAEIQTLEAELASQKSELGLADAAPARHAARSQVPDLILGRLSGAAGGATGSPGIDPVVHESVRRLRHGARRVARQRQRLRQAERRLQQAQQTAELALVQLQTGLQALGKSSLEKAAAEASQLLAQLRRHEHLEERLAQLEELERELQQQNRYLLDRQVLPVGVLLGVGAIFVASVVLAMAGLFMPKTITGSFGWLMSLGGGLGLTAAVLAKMALERSYARRLDACQRQLHGLQQQLKQVEEDRRELARTCPVAEGTLSARIEAAEEELAQLESLAPLEAERKAAERDAEKASQQIAQLKSALHRAESAWRQALARLDLPENLTFRQVRNLLEQSSNWQHLQQRLEQCYQAYEQTQHTLDQLQQRAEQIASQLGIGSQQYSASELAGVLAAQWREEQSRWKTRRRLMRRLRLLRQRSAANRAAVRRLRGRYHRLLRRCGVASREQLDAIASHGEQVEELRRQRDRLQSEIEAALAGQCTWEEMEEYLREHSPEKIGAESGRIDRELEQVRTKLHELSEQRGRTNEQLASLGSDRQPAVAAFELCQVREELRRASFRWCVLAATTELLRRAKQGFERRHQPETLRLASGLFERLTAGRYRRVWAPLEGQSLCVDSRRGETYSVENLSEGTREQLFICLRLALAQRYAQAGTRLPLVLDDVLANFDDRRTKLAAELLRQLAQDGQQILVFTCHAHTAKLFARLEVPVLGLPRYRKTRATRRRSASPRSKRSSTTRPPAEITPAPKVLEPPKESPVPPAAEDPKAPSAFSGSQNKPPEQASETSPEPSALPALDSRQRATDLQGLFDAAPVDVLGAGSSDACDLHGHVRDVCPDPGPLGSLALGVPCNTVDHSAEPSECPEYGGRKEGELPQAGSLPVPEEGVQPEASRLLASQADSPGGVLREVPSLSMWGKSAPEGDETETMAASQAELLRSADKLAELRAAVLSKPTWAKQERPAGNQLERAAHATAASDLCTPRIDYYGDQASYDSRGNRIAPEPIDSLDRKPLVSAGEDADVPVAAPEPQGSTRASGDVTDLTGLRSTAHSGQKPEMIDSEEPDGAADGRFGEAA